MSLILPFVRWLAIAVLLRMDVRTYGHRSTVAVHIQLALTVYIVAAAAAAAAACT